MNIHDTPHMRDMIENQFAEVMAVFKAEGVDGALVVGIATPSGEESEVTVRSAASLSSARMPLVLSLLEAMIDDPASWPELVEMCHRMAAIAGVRLGEQAQRLQ